MQTKYHYLVVQGANTLSATWSKHLPTNATALPTLPYIEWNILKDAQTFPDNITLESLRILNPYLPEHHAHEALHTLVRKGLLSRVKDHCYFFSEQTRRFIRDMEQALQAAASAVQSLTVQQANRLSALTTGLVDGLKYGQCPIHKPAFELTLNAVTPSENSLPQLQQHLFALQAYYEDAFIAAWKNEGYTPVAIRVANYILPKTDGVSIAAFLKVPEFYDEKYVRGGIGTLIERGDVIETGMGYSLTAKGIFHCRRVHTKTEELFAAPFEQYLSASEQQEWLGLMSLLIGAK